jgi:hypothetical protein
MDLNNLKEEMINKSETLLEIQSIQDVLATRRVFTDAFFVSSRLEG